MLEMFLFNELLRNSMKPEKKIVSNISILIFAEIMGYFKLSQNYAKIIYI
jgi:hypothetical protein